MKLHIALLLSPLLFTACLIGQGPSGDETEDTSGDTDTDTDADTDTDTDADTDTDTDVPCTNHWTGTGCTQCPGNWDPVADCNSCLSGWQGTDCTIRKSTITIGMCDAYYYDFARMAIDPATDLPVLVHFDASTEDLNLLRCTDAACTDHESYPIELNAYWDDLAITVTAAGLPVLTFSPGASEDVQVLTCRDANCTTASKNTSLTGTPSTATIIMGSDDLPVVAFGNIDGDGPAVVHCEDTDCLTASNEVVDSDFYQCGKYQDLAVAQDGNPSLVYDCADELRFAHCADPACTDAAIQSLGSLPDYVWPALASSPAGFPIIAFCRAGTALIVFCDDTVCTNPSEVVLDDVDVRCQGTEIELALGKDGFPIIAYGDRWNGGGALVYVECLDATCTTLNTEILADYEFSYDLSMETTEDATVISWTDNNGCPIQVLHCPDNNCL